MLPKRTHLWECKANESIETDVYLILMMWWEIIYLSYDVLILQANFHDVWVEWNGTLYRAQIG